MSAIELLAAAAVAGAVAALVWMFLTGAPVVLQVLGRPTTPIAELRPGEVEIAGVISAEQPVLDPHGRPCAVVSLGYSGLWWVKGARGKPVAVSEESEGVVVGSGLVVRDRTGACRLLAPAAALAVSAGPRSQQLDASEVQELLRRSPGLGSVVSVRPQVRLVGRSIRVGARVLVSGWAREDATAASDRYREGAGRAFVIGPADGRKLLVSAGGQGHLLTRAVVPLLVALVMVAATLGLLGLAWSIRQGVG